jgi:hypothetical protein
MSGAIVAMDPIKRGSDLGREWFAANPGRVCRVRRALVGELPFASADQPWVIPRLILPSFRLRTSTGAPIDASASDEVFAEIWETVAKEPLAVLHWRWPK